MAVAGQHRNLTYLAPFLPSKQPQRRYSIKSALVQTRGRLVTVPLYRNASIILMGVLEAKKEFITAI
jgi:hypothetical protein